MSDLFPGMEEFPDAALRALEERARGAPVRVLGRGELSVVLAWEAGGRTWACKRLPPFAGAAHLLSYARVLLRYEDRLRGAGVPLLPGRLVSVPGQEQTLAYMVQPALSPAQVLTQVLGAGGGAELLAQVVAHAARCTTPQVGFDAQLSNWGLAGGRLWYLDTTSALLREADGRSPPHADLFVGTLPRPLQGLVRAHLLERARDEYFDLRAVLRNAAANLHKERLTTWVAPLLALCNQHLRAPLTAGEVRRTYWIEELRWRSFQVGRRLQRGLGPAGGPA